MQGQATDRLIEQLQQRILQLERDNSELASDQARLRAILDNEPECVKLLAADGSLLEMNPAGLRMLEANSLEDVRNQCVYPLIVEEHRTAFRSLNEAVLAGGSGVLEFEIVGLKGGRRWLETHASPLRDAAGAVTAMLGLSRDITRRKAAEALVAQQLSEMEQLYRTAPVGLALLDRDLRFVRVNERLAEIDGRSVADHVGRTLEEVVPALSGQLRKLFQRVLDTGSPVLDLELGGFTPAEPTVEGHWLVNYLPVRDGDGPVTGVSAVVVDITERKNIEAERAGSLAREHAAKKQVDQILDSVSDAFVALDKDWRYTYVNRRAGEIFRRRPGDLIGKHIWTEFPEGLGQSFHLAYEKAFAEQVPQTIEEYYPPYDLWFENRIYPHPDGMSIVFQDITSRKRSERALQESEQRLLDAQRIGRIGDWTLEVATGRISWSPQVYALYERNPALDPPSYEEYLAGKEADHSDIVESNIARLLATGQPQSYELQLTLPSGARAYHAVVAVPIHDDSGQLTGVRGIVQDIGERKQAEAAVRQSERQLRRVMDGLGQHMFVGLLDPRGVVLMTNRPARSVASLEEEDVIGRRVEDTYWWDYSPEVRQRIQQAMRRAGQGDAVRYDEQIRVAEGQFIWIDLSINPLCDESGTVESLVASAIVINDRKQVESALRRNEEILRLFVEYSPAAIAMFDRDMNYIVSSRRYLADYGLTEPSVEGRCHYEVFPEISDAWKAMHQRCLAGAIEKSEADPFPRADGSLDWIRWELHPWRESSGEIGGIILFSEVITERVQARQQLRDAASRQQALARRLVEVQEAEQRHLSAELHDRIGQNLTALSINLNIISSRNGQANGETTAARLEDSRKLLETTIASVRDLITELRPPALDDYGLLAGLRWFGEQVQTRTGLQISLLGEEPSPRLEPRVESALFRIAQEALTNIVKHARAQKVLLTLQREAGRLTLDIADDGCGFDPPTPQRPGLRAHWGLEMMGERAEAVGARLRVVSTPGQGTRIVVDLEIAS